MAKECLPSTSPCYQWVVEQAGRTMVLHGRKPKPRSNSSFTQSPRESACLRVTGLLVSGSFECPENISLTIRGFLAWGQPVFREAGGALGQALGQGSAGLQLEPKACFRNGSECRPARAQGVGWLALGED